jgi:hypothetical protein
MKERINRLIYSDRFVIITGLIVVPILSFILITLSEESPLYTSISRIAWIHDRWLATFLWAIIVMGAITWITYRMVKVGPLSERTKRIYVACQTINIILVFVGCIVFPAKEGTDIVKFVNYVHDYLTIIAWIFYGIGLLIYSILLRRHDRYLGFIGIGLMSFIIFSSAFFISRVVDPTSYVGASAVSEVYIINSLLIYLVVMYLLERIKLDPMHPDRTEPKKP